VCVCLCVRARIYIYIYIYIYILYVVTYNTARNVDNFKIASFPFSFFLSFFSKLFYLLIVGTEGYCYTWSRWMTHARTDERTHTNSIVLLLTRHRRVAETSTWQYTTFTIDRQAFPQRDLNTQPQQGSGYRNRRKYCICKSKVYVCSDVTPGII
jgi:hypothetical protein